jgi:hypothetical protein
LTATNGVESEACANGKNSAAVIESNTMASASLTAIQRPARRVDFAWGPSRSQGDARRKQQAIAEESEPSGEGQRLRPEPERVGEGLRAFGG